MMTSDVSGALPHSERSRNKLSEANLDMIFIAIAVETLRSNYKHGWV